MVCRYYIIHKSNEKSCRFLNCFVLMFVHIFFESSALLFVTKTAPDVAFQLQKYFVSGSRLYFFLYCISFCNKAVMLAITHADGFCRTTGSDAEFSVT